MEKRKQLTTAQLDSYSQQIADQFITMPLANVRYLHVYYPIPGKGEVDTIKIVSWVRNVRSDIKIVLSRLNKDDNTLDHILWREDTPLAMNSWGITEPELGEAVSPFEVDMILVPLLVCDKNGHRVGYGKGFYDRFLADCRWDAQKIGLSFFDPVEEISNTNQFDIPLNACITPGKVLNF